MLVLPVVVVEVLEFVVVAVEVDVVEGVVVVVDLVVVVVVVVGGLVVVVVVVGAGVGMGPGRTKKIMLKSYILPQFDLRLGFYFITHPRVLVTVN